MIRFLIDIITSYKEYRGRLLFCVVVSLIISILSIIQPVLMLRIFDQGVENGSINQILINTILFSLVATSQTFLESYSTRLTTTLNKDFSLNLRKKFIEIIKGSNGDIYQKNDGGLLYTLLYHDIEKIPNLITVNLINLIKNVVTLAGLTCFLFSLQYQLLIVLILFQIVMVFSQQHYYTKVSSANNNLRSSVIERNIRSQEFVLNLKAIVVSGLFNLSYENLLDSERKNKKCMVESVMCNTRSALLIGLINSIMVASILCVGGFLVVSKSISIGALITFNIFSQRFSNPISYIYRFPLLIQDANLSWSSLKKHLTAINEIRDCGTATRLNNGEIVFDNVSFKYEDSDVLKQMSFRIPDKSTCLVIGTSGSGKTTLLKLIYRLWNPQYGYIKIGGTDIREIALSTLRSEIAFVPQEPFFLNSSLRENLCLGEKIDDEILEETLTGVGLSDWYRSLSDKLETCLGDNGLTLSGGEKQRLSIARVLLKKPSIVLLDEPTSMLDKDTEYQILKLICESFSQITTLIVTHKPQLIDFADQTIRIERAAVEAS